MEKVTYPGNKKIYRIYDKATGKIRADLITLEDEQYDANDDLIIFDPKETWKKTKLKGGTYTMRELLVPIFKDGKQVYELPSLQEIRAYHAKQIESMWEEVKRFTNPHNYYVDLSEKLWSIKHDMLKAGANSNKTGE
jgi:nicotinate phosphoribosyltransferase